jgi:hypothetical protein
MGEWISSSGAALVQALIGTPFSGFVTFLVELVKIRHRSPVRVAFNCCKIPITLKMPTLRRRKSASLCNRLWLLKTFFNRHA